MSGPNYIFCCLLSGRKQQDKKQQNTTLIPQVDVRPNGGKQPIFKPLIRARSTDDAAEPALDRSGHGDLGLGLLRQASHEGLAEDGQVDVRGRGAPRQDSVPNR